MMKKQYQAKENERKKQAAINMAYLSMITSDQKVIAQLENHIKLQEVYKDQMMKHRTARTLDNQKKINELNNEIKETADQMQQQDKIKIKISEEQIKLLNEKKVQEQINQQLQVEYQNFSQKHNLIMSELKKEQDLNGLLKDQIN